MPISPLEVIALLLAAFFAGVVNSMAGGGTLITFPVLLWTGIDPKVASITSTVALWPGSVGGALGYRRELQEIRQFLVRLSVPSLLGGALGAWLLRETSKETFSFLVPYLILFATILFMGQEAISRRLWGEKGPERGGRFWWAAFFYQLGISVYGGYFGAGLGILMLAGLGFLGVTDIHKANGLKNILGALINGVAVILFILFEEIRWLEALLMAVGSMAGGYGGAGIARWLGRPMVRRIVILVGLGLGGYMLWRAQFS